METIISSSYILYNINILPVWEILGEWAIFECACTTVYLRSAYELDTVTIILRCKAIR